MTTAEIIGVDHHLHPDNRPFTSYTVLVQRDDPEFSSACTVYTQPDGRVGVSWPPNKHYSDEERDLMTREATRVVRARIAPKPCFPFGFPSVLP